MNQLSLFDELPPPTRKQKRTAGAIREQTNYQGDRADLWRICPIEQYEVGGHTLPRMGGLMPIEGRKFIGRTKTGKARYSRFRSLEANIQPQDYPKPTHGRQPLIVALGMGTDSVAMLIEMKRRGIRPDIVQWADTGSERIETYRYVRIIQQWLRENGFPPLLIVRLRCPGAGHESLFAQLWNTEQLPSPAFHRNHSCSAKWKLDPQRKYHEFLPWMQDTESRTAIGFSAEETGRRVHGVAEAIGFSADEDGRKSYQMQDGDGYITYYPLREWDLTRADCVRIIDEEGLPQPGKSACFFCPMSKKCELREMDRGQLAAALAVEQRAEDGGKLNKIRGLRKGSNESWAEWLDRDDEPTDLVTIGLTSDLRD